MAADDAEDKEKVIDQDLDIDKYIEEKERMEALIQEKFTRVLTVMFTDLKGSTSIAETQGDLATRTLLKHHNEIVFPVIKNNRGVLVKTIGDGTLSYFENAQDGVRAGVQIQKGIDEFNLTKKLPTNILIRIGLHTGKCIMDKSDIFGDTVNTASRFESTANAGEVCFSEDTYNALTDRSEMYCRFLKTATLKGKKEPVHVYKAFWNKEEIEADKIVKPQEAVVAKKGMATGVKIALMILIPMILVLLYTQLSSMVARWESATDKRSVRHSTVTPGGAGDEQQPNDK